MVSSHDPDGMQNIADRSQGPLLRQKAARIIQVQHMQQIRKALVFVVPREQG